MATSSAVKRQRKRKRLDSDGDPEFQVAPMVDVLLVLMLFFMAIMSTEVLKNDKKVLLPEATHAKPNEDHPHEHEITVNVEWNPFTQSALYVLDSFAVPTPDGLAGAIAARHNADAASYVVIRADKDVEYSNISDLMTVCANAGIGSVAFSVLLNNNHPSAPAPATASQ
jgi:biopolymer transport protein ExbD